MDPERFDRLARFLSTTPTRRLLLTSFAKGTAGAAVAALIDVRGGEKAAASDCKRLGTRCGRAHQCCGHKSGRVMCAQNHHPGLSDHTVCCVAPGERCSTDVQCCGAVGVTCSGGRCTAITSDRAVKADFATVDGQAVLAQVAALPIQTWRYRTEDPAVRHMGPMAQDFAASFQLGDDDRHIHAVDGQGVALAAIQGLLQEVQALQTENAALAARVTALESRPAAR
jgi:hypothetical protein